MTLKSLLGTVSLALLLGARCVRGAGPDRDRPP